jgi:hypothetical protein
MKELGRGIVLSISDGREVAKLIVSRNLFLQIVILFLVGWIVGVVCDQIHVQFAVLQYSNPDLLGQPWWVGLQYGLGAVIGCVVAWAFVPAATAARLGKALMRMSLWFFGAYLTSGLLGDHPGILGVLLYGSWIGRMISLYKDWTVIVFSIALAIVGTLYEILLSGSNTYTYLGAQLLGVPIWLPGLYLHAGPFLIAVSGIFAIRKTEDLEGSADQIDD